MGAVLQHIADIALPYMTRIPKGQVKAGDIPVNMARRPRVDWPDGKVSTTRSMSFETPQGEMLVPTIREDGWPMSNQQARQWALKTGRNLGTFDTPENADLYATDLHNWQAYEMGRQR
jgi:hypothetical protein